jgi:prepilin-type processing-associated H-X9-DG protein
VQRGPLPGLELLVERVKATMPQSRGITLVHGDAKHGNFAFVDGAVSAIFDWEMATLGDPWTDVAWMEILWTMPSSFTSLRGAPDTDEFVARYEALSDSRSHHREWYRAHQALKMATIMLVASMHFDAGLSDDLRLAAMGFGIPMMTQIGLSNVGVHDQIEAGLVTPRAERVAAVQEAAGRQR